MVFGRRKSGFQLQVTTIEPDSRQRNRLSKPLTARSTTNLAQYASLEPVPRSSNNSTADLTPAPLSPQKSTPEIRQHVRAHVFDTDDGIGSSNVSKIQAGGNGVAFLISKIEEHEASSNASQQSLVSNKSKGPISTIFGSRRPSGEKRPSFNSENSTERSSQLRDDSRPSPLYPTPSAERIVDITIAPPSRRASFTPGTATRKSSGLSNLNPEEKQDFGEGSIPEDNELSFNEGDEYLDVIAPPSQDARSGTPASMDYRHLGALSLGSLHVVNGRASPAISEMSRSALGRVKDAMRRDASSVYGDSEVDAASSKRSLASAPAQSLNISMQHRDFSWWSTRNASSKFEQLTKIEIPQSSLRTEITSDLASRMAAEYMAELPASPYSVKKSSSLRRSYSRESMEQSLTPTHSVRRMDSSIDGDRHSLSSTGSVLRTTTKANELDDELLEDDGFEDEAVNDDSFEGHAIVSSPNFTSQTIKVLSSPTETVLSPVESDFTRDEAFQSALEFQIPKSPEVEMINKREKSDSGYSSNNSLRSSSADHTDLNQGSQLVKRSSKASRSPILNQAFATQIFRPILKTSKTDSPVPIFQNLRPSISTIDSSLSCPSPQLELKDTKEKPGKTRKRLRKRRSQYPSEIMVQSVQHLDGDTIPPVSENARVNLRIRSSVVPELETTVGSMELSNHLGNVSLVDLNMMEVRFPSPGPENQVKRQRSRSRRISQIEKSREDRQEVRRASWMSQDEALAIINDSQTAAASCLADNPYELVREDASIYPYTLQSLAGYQRPLKAQVPRSMMDDKTASELARRRSRSIQERDTWTVRRTSFNDRGGIPGKNLRITSTEYDAPPLPPLPHQQSMNHSQQVFDCNNSAFRSSSPPPLPPTHSPRPVYIEPDDLVEDISLAPPPPSHSPLPMDVSHQDPWAAQAAAWKARRQSASESLKRQSWADNGQYAAPSQSAESIYSALPNPQVQQYEGYQQSNEPHRQPLDYRDGEYTQRSAYDLSYTHAYDEECEQNYRWETDLRYMPGNYDRYHQPPMEYHSDQNNHRGHSTVTLDQHQFYDLTHRRGEAHPQRTYETFSQEAW